MQFREYVKDNKALAIAASVASLYLMALGAATAYSDTLGVLRTTRWLLLDERGKAVLFTVGLLVFVGFWVIWPWVQSRTIRARATHLCSRVDALAAGMRLDGHDYVHTAMAVGAVVVKMRGEGVFRSHPKLEEEVDLVLRRQSIVQVATDDPRHPSAQGEYMAFWLTRRWAARSLGMPEEVEVNPAVVAEGCALISSFVRSIWSVEKRSPRNAAACEDRL